MGQQMGQQVSNAIDWIWDTIVNQAQVGSQIGSELGALCDEHIIPLLRFIPTILGFARFRNFEMNPPSSLLHDDGTPVGPAGPIEATVMATGFVPFIAVPIEFLYQEALLPLLRVLKPGQNIGYVVGGLAGAILGGLTAVLVGLIMSTPCDQLRMREEIASKIPEAVRVHILSTLVGL